MVCSACHEVEYSWSITRCIHGRVPYSHIIGLVFVLERQDDKKILLSLLFGNFLESLVDPAFRTPRRTSLPAPPLHRKSSMIVFLLFFVFLLSGINDVNAFVQKHTSLGTKLQAFKELKRIPTSNNPLNRFDRTAADYQQTDGPECIITIDGVRYNITSFQMHHPGGNMILQHFNGKDASKAFHAVAHSTKTYEMMRSFAINDDALNLTNPINVVNATTIMIPNNNKWSKLFTREDPKGFHKILGVYVLLHFIYRHGQMMITGDLLYSLHSLTLTNPISNTNNTMTSSLSDPSCGLGSRMGQGPSMTAALCVIPHALLSLSSMIFHIPRERIANKPMIWQGR